MNREIAEEWARRLPAYKQGTGALRRVQSDGSETFCCLGVLCEIAAEKGITQARQMGGDTRYLYGDYDTGSASGLPPEVQKWAGMFSIAGDFRDKCSIGGALNLVTINDNGNKSFEEIAAIILRQVENL